MAAEGAQNDGRRERGREEDRDMSVLNSIFLSPSLLRVKRRTQSAC